MNASPQFIEFFTFITQFSTMEPIPKKLEIKSGFFPSLIYLPLPPVFSQEPFLLSIQSILVQHQIQHQSVQELHVSLTKTFHPLKNEIPRIVSTLK